MPEPVRLEKAELRELDDRGEQTADKENWTIVQFNPETLKVSYANQVVPPSNGSEGGSTGDQRGNAGIQYVGKGTTKLSVQLWYDVTWINAAGDQTGGQGQTPATDVQQLTKKVLYFITPQPDKTDSTKLKPPGVRFVWGTFQFDGIMESLEQSLEFFSSDGQPLRANINLSLTKQEIVSTIRRPERTGAAGAANAAAPGNRAMTQARSGDTVQSLAGRQGQAGNWQAIAEANGIENPRQLAPGQLIDINAPQRPGVRS